jgi:hypothetical protein
MKKASLSASKIDKIKPDETINELQLRDDLLAALQIGPKSVTDTISSLVGA